MIKGGTWNDIAITYPKNCWSKRSQDRRNIKKQRKYRINRKMSIKLADLKLNIPVIIKLQDLIIKKQKDSQPWLKWIKFYTA